MRKVIAAPDLLAPASNDRLQYQPNPEAVFFSVVTNAPRVELGSGQGIPLADLNEAAMGVRCITQTVEDTLDGSSSSRPLNVVHNDNALKACDAESSQSSGQAQPANTTDNTIARAKKPEEEAPSKASANQPNVIRKLATSTSPKTDRAKAHKDVDNSSVDPREPATKERLQPKPESKEQKTQPLGELGKGARTGTCEECVWGSESKRVHNEEDYIPEIGQKRKARRCALSPDYFSGNDHGDPTQMSSRGVEAHKKPSRGYAIGGPDDGVDDSDGRRNWYSTVVWYRTIVACVTAAS